MKSIYLSVIIPCYNEIANLQKGVLGKVDAFLNIQKYSYEILIVDDGSNDGSVEFIQNYIKGKEAFKLIQNPHMGKAGAVTTGMLKAKGSLRLFTDTDQATPIDEINKLLPFVEKFDIIIGSRSSRRKGAPLSRAIMAKGMIIVRKILVGITDINDTQCGFKLFHAPAAEKIFKKIDALHHGFKKISGSSVTAGFDVEVLYIAKKSDFSIKEVPVIWQYVETRRVSPIKDSIDGLTELLKIRTNSMSGKYT